MAWYVFALVDEPPRRAAGRGFASALTFRRVPGGFAAVERRADVPPLEMGALKQHDAIVSRLWADVPAILPVRFGTLIDSHDLAESLAERDEEVVDAFADVRGRAQFTWRRLAAVRPSAPATRPRSGAEYLRQAAGQGTAIPSRYAPIRQAVAAYVRRERFQPAAAPRPERLYHLVAKEDADAYQSAAGSVVVPGSVAFTGPWPPYAFVPEIL